MNKVYERRDVKYSNGRQIVRLIESLCEEYQIKPQDIELEVDRYDDTCEAELCFYRPMTDEEIKAEERRQRLLQEQIIWQKREQLERLKKELGET